MQPNPHDMLVFLEVIEARSFTGASENLGLTKSAVSQAVTRLERDIGHRLIFRSTRAISLTDAGARLLAHCKSLNQLQAEISKEFESSSADRSETLTVTAPHALCDPVIVPVLSEYLARNSKASVRLVAEDAPINLVERKIDIAIRVGAGGPQTAYVSRLGNLQESLFAGATYVNAMGGVPKELSPLADWAHIANEWQGSPVKYSNRGGSKISVVPRIRCNTQRDVLNFVQSGFGIALLPDVIVEKSTHADDLVRLFSVSKTPVFSLHHYGTRVPAMVREFTKLVRRRLNVTGGNG